ncbi:hypothetical protein [Micromonospora pisi]|uniref:hypothetical protein n=1 Tax=Micromonospora pisi TaxID=589240 RepID=UPI001476CE3F|nr:hypothetical protein [Micromonospora pisi]
MLVREPRSAVAPHLTSREEQRWRAARRRMRETLALRRAEAAAGRASETTTPDGHA